jgi:hypothetical protein
MASLNGTYAAFCYGWGSRGTPSLKIRYLHPDSQDYSERNREKGLYSYGALLATSTENGARNHRVIQIVCDSSKLNGFQRRHLKGFMEYDASIAGSKSWVLVSSIAGKRGVW